MPGSGCTGSRWRDGAAQAGAAARANAYGGSSREITNQPQVASVGHQGRSGGNRWESKTKNAHLAIQVALGGLRILQPLKVHDAPLPREERHWQEGLV